MHIPEIWAFLLEVSAYKGVILVGNPFFPFSNEREPSHSQKNIAVGATPVDEYIQELTTQKSSQRASRYTALCGLAEVPVKDSTKKLDLSMDTWKHCLEMNFMCRPSSDEQTTPSARQQISPSTSPPATYHHTIHRTEGIKCG